VFKRLDLIYYYSAVYDVKRSAN